jgi:3-dehydroquinate synthase
VEPGGRAIGRRYTIPMDPIRIDVPSERGTYQVLIGPGLASRLPALLDERGLTGDRLVVSSPPVWRLHSARLRGLTGTRQPTLVPDGERFKTLATTARIYDALVRREMDRTAVLVAFGGGVVGDVAGFAAATYLRGIRLVQVPTTLLAQVDSAIGGKTGVNLAAGKNLVGAFHAPSLVVADPEVLGTLPRREFRAGLYEVVKYGVIASRALFDRVAAGLAAIFAQDMGEVVPLVGDCCRIKASVVSRDEREAGLRRLLNFGHTVGHALEAVTRYRRFRHGEAVAYGMLAAARVSAARGMLADDDEARLKDLILHLGPLPLVTDLRTTEALEAIHRDKKVVRGRLHFVLATSIGSTMVVDDVQTRELRVAMRSLGMKA